jgi:hypothetical protein
MRNYSFKIAVLIILIAFSSNISLSAEGINKPFEKTPVISDKNRMAKENESFLHKTIREEAGDSLKQLPNPIETNSKQSPFVKSIFIMLKALFAVLILIGSLFGGMVIYQWLKNNVDKNKPPQQPPSPLETREPETVSEAVASFVKHKLRK